MAKMCLADKTKGQSCANCAHCQRDTDRDYKYNGNAAYSCFAKADKYGNVYWEKAK